MSPRPACQSEYRSASPRLSVSPRRHHIASNTATVQIYALGPSGPVCAHARPRPRCAAAVWAVPGRAPDARRRGARRPRLLVPLPVLRQPAGRPQGRARRAALRPRRRPRLQGGVGDDAAPAGQGGGPRGTRVAAARSRGRAGRRARARGGSPGVPLRGGRDGGGPGRPAARRRPAPGRAHPRSRASAASRRTKCCRVCGSEGC